MNQSTITTKGGRKLRRDRTVAWSSTLLRWVVVTCSYWGGEPMTIYEAEREARRRNAGQAGLFDDLDDKAHS